MKIAVGSDHVGWELKNRIISYLGERGHETADMGAYGPERTDYPVYAKKVAQAVADGTCENGILICGTGVGMSIAANKVRGVRAAACSEPYSAKLAKEHNNANVLCFGSRVVGCAMAEMMADMFLSAVYEGGRHQRRVDMIGEMEAL